jgi:hypothetical protein
MRKLRILEHISLDGVIQPGGRGEDGDDYRMTDGRHRIEARLAWRP